MKNKASFILMYIAFFIYSLSGICLKVAAQKEFFSFPFLLYMGISMIILGCYALLWQIVLKKVQLSIAMANKPVTLILTVIWSVIFFSEHLSIASVAGILLIVLGIAIIGKSENAE